MTSRKIASRRIARRLASLRGRLRLYVLLRGASEILAWAGLCFWVSLALDWGLDLPLELRATLFLIALGGAAYLLLNRLVGPLVRPLTARSLAVVVERRFPHFGGALLTAVEYAGRSGTPGEAVFLADVDRAVDERMRATPLWTIIRGGPLRARFWTAMFCVASVAAFVELRPELFAVWRDRLVSLGDERWPRATRLTAVGFQDGVIKTPRGADFDLVVQADLTHNAPAMVQIRYRGDEGVRGRATMTKRGRAVVGLDPYQDFVFRLPSLLASTTVDVFGGDDSLRGLRIEVVDAPALAELTFDCEYPDYTGRGAAVDVPLASVVRFPAGSRVTLRGRATKKLQAVEVARAGETLEVAAAAERLTPEGASFTYVVPRLIGDAGLLISLLDRDGIQTRRPVRVLLQAIADEPPQVDARPTGLGVQITPQARAPLAGTATDDYGVDETWVELQLNDQPAARAAELQRVDDALHEAAIDLRETIALTPGDRLALAVAARDACGLEQGPQTTVGQRFLFNVVTADELRASLETREIVMRARLESVVNELSATRDLILQIEPDLTVAAEGVETGEGELDPAASLARAKTLRRLRIERAAQNSTRFASESSGVAAGFEDLAVELDNNRIDAPDVRQRWLEQIADPLRRIEQTEFKDFDVALNRLAGAAEPAEIAAERDRSAAAADALLIALGEVLDRIESLADYNELLDQLRSLIDDQQEIINRTEQRRLEKIRELIGD